MTIECRCSNCGTLLRCSNCGTLFQTTNADPLHDEIERLRAALQQILDDVGPAAHNGATGAISVRTIARTALEQKVAPEGECPDCGEPLATGDHGDDCFWWNNKAADR